MAERSGSSLTATEEGEGIFGDKGESVRGERGDLCRRWRGREKGLATIAEESDEGEIERER